MVDQKLTGLTAITVLVGTDILYVVSDPGVTPLSRKITKDDFSKYPDGTVIFDSNGNEVIKVLKVASAVNEVTFLNAAIAGNPEIRATGTDTNIDLLLTGKGTGVPKVTSMKIVTILDTNGNELLKFTTTASAVNELTIVNSATLTPVQIQASGGDTNIDIKIVPKGTGQITAAGDVVHEKRDQQLKGADAASATIVTLVNGNFFDITGTTTITEILGTGWQAGAEVVLQFDGILTITNNSGGTNDILTGDGNNITTAAGFVLGLRFNGTDWLEVFRNTVAGGGANTTPYLARATAQMGAGGTEFFCFGFTEANNPDTAELDHTLVILENTTFTKMGALVAVNSLNVSIVYTFRDNLNDGNQTFTVTTTAVGFFQDTSNNDALLSGEQFCMKGVAAAGTGTINTRAIGVIGTPT